MVCELKRTDVSVVSTDSIIRAMKLFPFLWRFI